MNKRLLGYTIGLLLMTGCSTMEDYERVIRSMDGLVTYWDFADEDNPLCSDGPSSFTLSGDETVSPSFVQEEGPLSGHSLCFDGHQYLSIPYAETGMLNVHTGEVTVVAWVKSRGNDNSFVAGMWNEHADGGKRQYGLFASLPYYDGRRQVCGHISRNGGPTPPFPYSVDYSASAQLIPIDEWCCIAFTYDGDSIRSYVDGVLGRRGPELVSHTTGFEGYPNGLVRARNPYPFADGIGDNGSDFTVGAVCLHSGMGNFYQGLIGGLAVYNRALTSDELSALAAFSGKSKK